ncbi:MAG: hypothetical protein AAFO04_13880 [Cyanobacteria bacterium J06592_8]
MTGSHKSITEEIASLEEAIAKLAEEFDRIYSNYLTALGKAVRQQLILACYHLCTQGYPESFLKLSYSQRQKFQQNLQISAIDAQKELLSLVELSSASQALEEKVEEETEEEDLLQTLASEDGTLELSEDVFVQLSVAEPLTLPERLAEWQENLEKSIQKLLKTLSQDVNFAFKQAAIFPAHLPKKALEAASQAEASAETIASPPNLLNVVIQTEDTEHESARTVTRLTVVHLRLSEIEFADTGVMSERNQIRSLSGQLNNLGRNYQKKQREQKVLEAEAAWRSSWFEEKG